jgi:hypothetical protein
LYQLRAFDHNTIDSVNRQLQHILATYTVSILYRSPIGYIRGHINPHARLAAALLITLAFTVTTYVTFVAFPQFALHCWYRQSTSLSA